jgi:hypothetical protein
MAKINGSSSPTAALKSHASASNSDRSTFAARPPHSHPRPHPRNRLVRVVLSGLSRTRTIPGVSRANRSAPSPHRRLPNRAGAEMPSALVWRTASGFGNPRYSRLGNLRYGVHLYRRLPSLLYRRFPNRPGVKVRERIGLRDGQQVWKPAIQQTWKSAVRCNHRAPQPLPRNRF